MDILEIKKFDYYLVFVDDRKNYIVAYGYNCRPSILEFKYAVETLSNDKHLEKSIPDFHQIIDFICFEVMSYKKFLKYMEKQEKKLKEENEEGTDDD